MGTFHVRCKIENISERDKSAVVPKMLVDTGSEYTWIAETALREIGIKPEKRIRLVMANGSVLERDIGFALIMVGRLFTIDEVVFAQRSDLLLLGARTLEGLNVYVDLQAKKLVEAGPSPAAPLAGYTEEETREHWASFGTGPISPLDAPRAGMDEPKTVPGKRPAKRRRASR